MKRLLIVSLLVLCVCSMAFGYTKATKRSMGNTSNSSIHGTAADTWELGALLFGAKFVSFWFEADSVRDSLVNLVPKLEYKPIGADAWLSLTPVTKDAGDTWILDGNTSNAINTLWTWDTLPLVAATNFLTYDMLALSRFILTGKRATQAGKNCTLTVNIRYE